MNRWTPSATHGRVLNLLAVTAPLSVQEVARGLSKRRRVTSTTLYQMHRAGWLSLTEPNTRQRHESGGTIHYAYAPSPRAQLHLRGQWLTRPTRHLIAASELVDATFRDRRALMLNRPGAAHTHQEVAA